MLSLLDVVIRWPLRRFLTILITPAFLKQSVPFLAEATLSVQEYSALSSNKIVFLHTHPGLQPRDQAWETLLWEIHDHAKQVFTSIRWRGHGVRPRGTLSEKVVVVMRMSQYGAQICVVVQAMNEQLVEVHMDAASVRGAPTPCVVQVAQMAFIQRWRKSLCPGQRHKSAIGTRVRRIAIVGYTMFGVTIRQRTREKERRSIRPR